LVQTFFLGGGRGWECSFCEENLKAELDKKIMPPFALIQSIDGPNSKSLTNE